MKRESLILPLPESEATLAAIMAGLDRETRMRGMSVMQLLIESVRGAGFRGRLYRGQAMVVRDGKTIVLDDAIVYEFAPGDPTELPEFVTRIFKVSKPVNTI